MSTRLMLIRDSAPLPGRRVRIKGIEGEFTSDDDGMVEVPVESKSFSIAIRDTEDWIVKRVARTNTEASMIVVNVGEADVSRRRWNLTSRYEFEKVLGRGGMGVVVRANDTVLQRPVAIKMLSDEFLDNSEAQELFMTEGRAMATLSHPNLVTVHDVTEADGRVLMVLEFVSGQNVEELMRARRSLTAAEALSITIQVLRALEYLHNQGVIHRDLKPGNFMVDDDGKVKVIDFGLARSLDDLYDKGTRVRGTPAYMAPEQIRGEQMSAATDLYQMAVSLWELLVGSLPYSGELLYAHVHEEVPHIRDFDATIDLEIDELLWRCLQKDPKDRPQSTAAVRGALERIYLRVATNPDMGTAETAHIVEANVTSGDGRLSGGVPTLDPPLLAPPAESSPAVSIPDEPEQPEGRDRRILPAIAVISLLALGGIGAVFTGAFERPADAVDGGVSNAPAARVAERAEAPVRPPDDATVVVVDDESSDAAFLVARRTVRSSLSASRAGTAVASELREARESSARERRRESERERARATESTNEETASDEAKRKEPTADAPSGEPSTATTPPANDAKSDPAEAPSKVAEPAPFEPKTFDRPAARTATKKEKEPAPEEADSKEEESEKEPETQVPVSF